MIIHIKALHFNLCSALCIACEFQLSCPENVSTLSTISWSLTINLFKTTFHLDFSLLKQKWWSSGKGQARMGKRWPLRRKASKLKPLPRAYIKVGCHLPPPPPPTHWTFNFTQLMARWGSGGVGGGKGRCVGSLWVTLGSLYVGHLRVTVGHPRVTTGHLRLTIGYL